MDGPVNAALNEVMSPCMDKAMIDTWSTMASAMDGPMTCSTNIDRFSGRGMCFFSLASSLGSQNALHSKLFQDPR